MIEKFFKLVLILALSVIAACENEMDKWPSIPFGQQKWMQAKETDRFVFVKDLVLQL